ncbi:MAG: hypothetical protein OXP69_05505 [Spirochaetaceae bacterium]|nr:hypothetical protein [Spirochaetaceae bacterium]
MSVLATEADLIAAAACLAGSPERWSAAERRLARNLPRAPESTLALLREEIADGQDSLGAAFCRIRSPTIRRIHGATYTPKDIVDAMVSWSAGEHVHPARIVDPGAGSGRFLMAASSRFPSSRLVAVETDPVAALLLRATATTRGFDDRLTIKVSDYRSIRLPRIDGATLFIGNPPYVRHHDIDAHWKDWYARTAGRCGVRASKLAGLHLHFFLKTMSLGRKGDYGAFITSAEWLDVNYGRALRRLLADGLGGTALHVLAPAVAAFPDAASTAAITCFRIGQRPRVFQVRAVETRKALNSLTEGRSLPWSQVENAPRWSTILRPSKEPPSSYIELGELFQVHRGQVTGANRVWIAGDHAKDLPKKYLLPTVTRARELFVAGGVLADAGALRRVIDLPADLDDLPGDARSAVERFLSWAKAQHADVGYIARNRRSWWSVGLREPAPVVCTYMARRPPAFVRNMCDARLLNIAHGLYPREPLTEESIAAIIAWLKTNVGVDAGRTYAGGLTKFEPGEVERIPIPQLETLADAKLSPTALRREPASATRVQGPRYCAPHTRPQALSVGRRGQGAARCRAYDGQASRHHWRPSLPTDQPGECLSTPSQRHAACAYGPCAPCRMA